jgi:hypothetical protein
VTGDEFEPILERRIKICALTKNLMCLGYLDHGDYPKMREALDVIGRMMVGLSRHVKLGMN